MALPLSKVRYYSNLGESSLTEIKRRISRSVQEQTKRLITQKELTDFFSKSVSSLFLNNPKMLSNCCHKGFSPRKNPVFMRLSGVFDTTQTLFLRLFHPYFWWLLVPIIPVFRAIILCFNRSVYFSCTPKSGISLLSEFSIRRRYIKNEVIISKNSQKDNLVTSKILVGAGFHFLGSLRLFHFGGIYVRISIRAKTNRGLPTLPHLPAVCAVLNHRPEHPHRRQLLSFLLHHSLLLCQLPYLIPQD